MIGLVSCSQQKLSHAAPARELYCSPLFKLSLKYAESRCEKTYAISARHELVELDQVLEPYNTPLTKMTKQMRNAWGARVASKIFQAHPDQQFLLLAGVDYMLAIRYGTRHENQKQIEDPLKGMMIGQRLSCLKSRLAIGSHEAHHRRQS
jgi:hypothetical protein